MSRKSESAIRRDPDTFDLLGVSFREDSYSDLIVHAFRRKRLFRKRLLGLLGENDSAEWLASLRPRISRKDRKADVPDIVLHNDALGRIVVIENKVWSGEGYDQLKRYAERSFRKALSKRYFGSASRLAPDGYKLIYLTLDRSDRYGEGPEDKHLTYGDLWQSTLTPRFRGNDRLVVLLNELESRIRECEQWRPDPDLKLTELFESGPPLLGEAEILRRLITDLVKPSGAFNPVEGRFLNNPQHGTTPYVQLRQNRWLVPAASPSQFHRSQDVHFELQWLVADRSAGRRFDGLSFEIHFETNPYLTRSKAKQSQQQFELFRAKQNRFRQSFLESTSPAWRRPRSYGWVNAATFNHQTSRSDSYWIPTELSAGETAELISQGLKSGVRAINRALA